ncbi:uncharacterized protein EV420DRAFT_843978 [Desarmillaria tabescens]|uniref:Uncharacterized protein n=1 Tax=Armillaria tabescens TaxID=1929756 RepID=A0AA39MVC9_ARMTA|nr:uncharacterized protein EV420DRAFT_843978 [Desarmillaria tabescens]KAK0448456.1 hypothetical protein EV420DRAFT_843978 [Desarmillaria tabescens]
MVSGKHVHWDDSIVANHSTMDEPKKASVFLSQRRKSIPSPTTTTPLRRVPVPSMTSFNQPSPVSSQQPNFSPLPPANSTIMQTTPVRYSRPPSITGISIHVAPTPSPQDLSLYNGTPPSSANIPPSHRRRIDSLPTAHRTRPPPSHSLTYPISTLPRPQISPVALHPFANHPQPPPQKFPSVPSKAPITHTFLPFQRQSPPQQTFLPLPNHSPISQSPQVLTPSWKTNSSTNPSPHTFKQTPSSKLSIHKSLRLGTCEPIDFFAPQRVRAHASVASEPASQPPLPRLFILVDTGSDRFNIEVMQHQALGFVTVDNVLTRVQTVLRERLDPQTLGGSFVAKCECGGYMERRCSFTTLCVGLTVREDVEQLKWRMHFKKVQVATT